MRIETFALANGRRGAAYDRREMGREWLKADESTQVAGGAGNSRIVVIYSLRTTHYSRRELC